MNASSPFPFDITGLSDMEIFARVLAHHGMAPPLTVEQMNFLSVRYGSLLCAQNPGKADALFAEIAPVRDACAGAEPEQPTPNNVIDFRTAAAMRRAAKEECR